MLLAFPTSFALASQWHPVLVAFRSAKMHCNRVFSHGKNREAVTRDSPG